MLYLAEVLKKSGVFGSGKTELKLLASQRGEYNWVPVPGEDVVPADDGGNFNSGALVFADLNASKQVQGNLREAGGQLVKILQNFSRFQEKFKTQEEEIEQWKQSLTFQSQELNRREMEMESHREQVEQAQQELAQLESKRGEIETSQAEVDRLREELERSRSELESAWTQLQGEREELQGSSSLDDEQASSLKQWLDYLGEVIPQSEALREPLAAMETQLAEQQSWLDERTAQLEEWRSQAEAEQSDLDRQVEDLDGGWSEWHQSQLDLSQKRTDLQAKQHLLDAKEQFAQLLRSQVSDSEELANQLSNAPTSGGESSSSSSSVNWGDIERMPLNELHERVRELQQELETGMRLVIDEQEELMMQRLDLNELEAKLARAGGGEREQLQTELADQQESFGFLNETLVGQRRSLQERERIMKQHQSVLWRRLGNPPEATESGGASVDLSPLIARTNQQRQQQSEQLQQLESELQGLRGEIEELRNHVEQQAAADEGRLNELKERDRSLRDRRAEIAGTWGRVNAYQELLDSLRDRLQTVKGNCDSLSENIGHLDEMVESQNNAISHLQEIVGNLTAA